MKKLLGLVVSILAVGLVSGCSDSIESSLTSPDTSPIPTRPGDGDPPPDPPDCESGMNASLIAGQHHESGFVALATDGTTFLIGISMEEDWQLVESHVAFGASVEELPQRRGNPVPGRFADSAEHDAGTERFQYSLDLSSSEFEVGDEIYVAIHAVVERLDGEGQVVQSEGAWADGDGFPGRNWATYVHFTLGDCAEDEDEGQEGEGGSEGGGGE